MRMNEEFVDYYQVLRIWPTASDDAIKKAYFNMAKLFHPDVAGKSGDGKNGDAEADVDFKLINEAYAILSDPVKRREYDEELKRWGPRDRRWSAKEADKRSGQLAFEQARTAMKHNRYDKAVVLLKSAIKYDDTNAAYHSWYGFALGALSTRLHEARDACKKALEMEFYNADFHANLGYVYHQAGLKSTAEESFREALKWDPDHALALKYLNNNKKSQGGGFLKGLRSLIGLDSPPRTAL
ncbi:MAG: DnaJ domain-containing protein [Candidatus Latescibacterota bacterium]|nr:MAG: DnaJ domain-containing protein [Candidatus Latescibacterota bacterium]